MSLTYAELFAGAGGLSAGLDLAGWSAAAHAEIEPHARAVLRRRWPDVPLLGDVTAIDGATLRGITLLSGGSPCQDLSIAGKRAGMTEGSGTRSALYFEQVRIWQESEAPYFLWENVLGALSSNAGRDFAAVLSALVGAPLAVPDDGWGGAGVASGPAGVAAWRVLDCQYFGPPQRRRRVFVLGARAGGVDPAEVLALSESVSGHPAPRREAGEGPPADAGGGVASESGAGWWEEGIGPLRAQPGGSPSHVVFPAVAHSLRGEGFDASEDGTGRGTPIVVSDTPVGNGDAHSGFRDEKGIVLAWDDEHNFTGDVNGVLKARTKSGGTSAGVVMLRNCEGKPGGGKGPLVSAERSLTLGTSNDQVVFALDKQSGLAAEGVTPTLKTDLAHQMGPVVFATSGQVNAALSDSVALRLNATHEQPFIVHPTLNTTHFAKHAGCSQHLADLDATLRAEASRPVFAVNNDSRAEAGDITAPLRGGARAQSSVSPAHGIPRRLMPVECEKLMGWEPGATEFGVNESGARYALSDSARYRLAGNGVASPVAAWIGFRLRWALEG